MSRSRIRERERLRSLVETSDPAALAAYADELRPVVASYALAEGATARRSQRIHTRPFLRDGMLKSLRTLEARIDAAAREHRDLTSLSGAGPVA